MNRIIGIALGALSLLVLSASAQSDPDLSTSEQANCRFAKGRLVEDYNPETKTARGTLSRGGWLNGTTVSVDSSTGLPTPDPNVITFTQAMTLTTAQGELKGSRVFLYNVITGWGADMTTIDPAASTGIFAGATGVLYTNLLKFVTLDVGPYYSVVTGKICFTPGNEPPDR